MLRLFILLLSLLMLTQTTAGEENKPEEPIVLDTLRIEGYIYEPEVLFILEKPSIELITLEEKKQHDFLKDYDKPLMDTLY